VTLCVVDASVGVKWLPLFAKEGLVDHARELLKRGASEFDMIVPDLFWLEIGGALCKAVRRNDCQPSEAHEALLDMQKLPLQTLSSTKLVNSAQRIAIQYGRSIYDSVYVALARETGSEFVTADEKLANAVAAHLPVKWLGAF
jgi:predicted nucleic acid-binding protein